MAVVEDIADFDPYIITSQTAPSGGNLLHPKTNKVGSSLKATLMKPEMAEEKTQTIRLEEKEKGGGENLYFPDEVEVMGLKPVFGKDTSILRRIFWVIIVLFGAVFVIYQIQSQIGLYLTYPVTIYVNISHVDRLRFPRVVVCNYNFMRKSAFPMNLTEIDTRDISGLFEGKYAQYFNDTADWTQTYKEYAHQLNETLLECTWQNTPCTVHNFTAIYTDMGVCYAFNDDTGDAQITTVHSDQSYGLSLVLRVKDEDYLDHSPVAGFKVLVSEPTKPPLVNTHGLGVVPGGSSSISMRKQRIEYLGKPWENCRTTPLPGYNSYTRESCLLSCLTEYIISKCGCRQLYMTNISGIPVCSPPVAEDCCGKYRIQYLRDRPPCSINKCPVECNDINYFATLSVSTFSSAYIEHLKKSYGRDALYWQKNAVAVQIFYAEMIEEIVTHQPAFGVFTLLCDIGGAFGLILGASIISVIELFDFGIRSLQNSYMAVKN